MDETIGVKGGANDHRRSMIISREKKKMLEEYEEERETKELEKRVRKNQIYTLVKTLPIVVGGGFVQTLYQTSKGEKKEDKEEERSKWRIKEYNGDVSPLSIQEEERQKEGRRKIITTPTGEKVVVVIHIPTSPVVKRDTPSSSPVSSSIQEEKKEETKEDISFVPPMSFGGENPPKKNGEKRNIPRPVGVGDTIPQTVKDIENIDIETVDIDTFINHELADIDFSELSPQALEKLDKLRSRKIVDEYEKQLKDIRYELRKVIFEYNVLVDQNEDVILSKDAEIILDRLSDIIDKVEELKRKIRIDDLDQYDDNYIYYLIEGYLKEFRKGRVLDEMKDSPLYVMIAKKLDELEKKRDSFEVEVEDKKERLEEREIDFDKLKSDYYTIDQLNHQLLEFQYDQDRLLKEIQERVRNATTISERVQEEVVGLSQQSRRLLNFLSFQMFLPGPRFAKGLAASAATYLYFINNVVRPNTVTRRYRVITVQDYHSDIQNSITALDDAMRLLGKTSDQIDRMIIEVEDRYKDYLGVLPECDELLRNLRKVKSDMEEKEYEMERMKRQQELELEKNDAKVKTMGEYPVN